MLTLRLKDAEKVLSSIKSLREIKLADEEKLVTYYFVKYISVGEILAEKELKALGISNPLKVIKNLILKGVLERGEGCYNLAKNIREEVFSLKKKHKLQLRF